VSELQNPPPLYLQLPPAAFHVEKKEEYEKRIEKKKQN
jgi:hypothetical protein